MGKKREREENSVNGDGGGDADHDDVAESLLFEIAPSAPDGKPGSKRSKSRPSPPPQDSKGSADEHATAESTAVLGSETADSASAYHPAAIAPSSALRQCDGFDVVRKGTRGRGRQLMVLPGALGLGNGGSGGKLGTLNVAKPANPVLYVEFPEVRQFTKFTCPRCSFAPSRPKF